MTDASPESQGTTATLEPPAKPPAPPMTTTATPGRPPRKRRVGCWVAAIVLIVIVALAAGTWWLIASRARPAAPVANASAFDSAMTKAMVKAPGEPATPVDLSTIKARGTHTFDATFTADELAALLNAFPHEVNVGNASVSLQNVSVALGNNGELTLSGTVSSGGSAYSGKASGKVAFTNDQVVAAGPISVQAEGIDLGGAQAATATQLLLAYFNGYLRAAPGLTITSATVSSQGVHVRGLAPDTITY
ncbi:MAG: hypothetical protein P4L93_05595 [Coriobacteriia bacterium]|nr:hypothetical protein [Coriobacteriia bacterium]